MTSQIDRMQLLGSVQLCMPGTSSMDVIAQSACIVFRKGEMISFNNELSCRAPGYPNIDGAIRAEPLKTILERLTDKTLFFEQTDTHLVFKGKQRQLGVVRDSQIVLPLKHLERPTDWRKLPSGFIDGVNSVKGCAGRDENKFILTCIHIHPQYIESFDDYKFARYRVKTGVQSAVLVKQSSIKHIEAMGAEQISESARWLHFRNASGFILSCRKYDAQYPNLDMVAASKGRKVSLPGKLIEAAKRAGVFSIDSEDNLVEVTLQPSRVTLTGNGQFGWYSEVRELRAYNGPSFSFKVSPQMLEELLTKYRDCSVSDNALVAGDGKFVYVTSIMASTNENESKPTKRTRTRAS